MPSYEYKLTRSAGVLALRPVREIEIPNSDDIITQEFVGVAVDDSDVYRTSFVNGRTLLTDIYTAFSVTWKVTRINHPEEGPIWYADSTNTLFVNFDHVVYREPITGVSYGAGGAINGTTTGYRFTMIDGSTIFVTDIVLEI